MEWVERITRIRRWTRGGERDPNKSLLLLFALGKMRREGYAPLRFRDVEKPLSALLTAFGPPKPAHPGVPFHHLAGDGLWEVMTATGAPPPGPDPGALRAHDTVGRLTPRFAEALLGDRAMFARAVGTLLDLNFEPSLHDDLRSETGLPPGPAGTPYADPPPGRSPADMMLRQKTLVAYECRCAFCGYEGWIGDSVVGLEAARLRWRSFDGVDDLTNALCLCTLHHRLLDRGVLSLTSGGVILVSRHFVGATPTARTQVLALAGRVVQRPLAGLPAPSPRNTDWHTRQVFRTPAHRL
ncbi:phosphorothioated DNA-binding restriction endonuclease [Thermomonospora umbrina]|uniref:Putative restriction endonuclease n=1 Tax=Thermomonospora umbrina TaxID=111806 RepID=A0A3D9SLT9_9ACTN|nr:HNH endonuclease [Thermomonospora umbrina]REE96818.1 putative restriction endonuclease [Thermomonospora umbrina]